MQFRSSTKSPFPVFTDVDHGYALSLNLAIWVGPDLKRLLSSFGRSVPDYQGNEAWMLPIPATFVVGRDGIVSACFIDPDFRRRMSVDELIAAFKPRIDSSEQPEDRSRKPRLDRPGLPSGGRCYRAFDNPRSLLRRAETASPCGYCSGQIGWRDEHAEALAPDDHALVVLWIDARRDWIALTALEGAQTTEIDEHCVLKVRR